MRVDLSRDDNMYILTCSKEVEFDMLGLFIVTAACMAVGACVAMWINIHF